jgi:superfamily II DNA or RNA helicase
VSFTPRAWQSAFLSAHAAASTNERDFLLVATLGAGKTLAACEAARLADCDQVIVVCPTTALRSQWADAADRVGLHLDPRWRNADGAWRPDPGRSSRHLDCRGPRTTAIPNAHFTRTWRFAGT